MYKYKKTGSLLWAIMLTCCTSACVTSKYKTPALDLPDTYRTDSASVDSNLSDSGIATIPYHDFFTDTILLKLIDSSVTRNYNLQIALKQIAYAQQAFKQAKWGNVPTVSLTAGQASITRSSDNSLNGLTTTTFLGQSYIEDYNSNFSISWEADIWGKIKSRKDAALASYLQSKEAVKAVKTKLVSDVTQGYYNLLMLDAQLDITKKSISLFDSSIRVTTFLRDAGNVTTLAVDQLEAAKEQAIASLPLLEQQLLAQENALSFLTGQNPQKIERTATLSSMQLHAQLPVGIPVNMVSQRPDIRESEMTLMQAHAMVNVARASLYPTLSISGQGGVNAFEASNWFKIPGSLFGLASGSLVQPILQNKRLQTQYQQSKIAREQAELQFKQSVLSALIEVSNALSQIDKLKNQELHISKQVAFLEQAVKNSGLLYNNGDATYLDVLTAQINKLQADLNLASLQRQRLSAEVILYQSLGGGWK
ncbi:efflux transporter, outer membrane factor (OMF) lipoprotein, NodT family [Chitinophaga costaii]|uniref:Efflux transporter, outer membrane factor (OMF) lipoprotein, NodT family n=1 Tax=Chitinophaga costaii TaxID=1335309 RepID=A0A1C4FZ69_9BACT|nr:efflux transporter outer membrane subunit [Chitinophaga costaii]PUZ20945.1 RND transporter [Chitinophaga costaii]SCC61228.1 efflux transporter, outer membrane factor (OMF) lipoprotein, NodT family [Chitinophaga costaii]